MEACWCQDAEERPPALTIGGLLATLDLEDYASEFVVLGVQNGAMEDSDNEDEGEEAPGPAPRTSVPGM